MTVERNVAFGLEVRGVAKDELRHRVGEALERVRLSGLGARRPNELSGGQQQRVALARAIVYRPDVLLLDEPLSNLDARLRAEMRSEIRRTVTDLGITAIYVTHDQQEALSMADRVVLMRDGRVEQAGGPRDLYERPRNRFVAGFLGDANFLEATTEGPICRGPRTIRTPAGSIETMNAAEDPSGSVRLACIRHEALVIRAAADVPSGEPALRGVVRESTFLGDHERHVVDCSGIAVVVVEWNPRQLGRRGEPVALTVKPEQVAMLDGP
jgi:ABC-type Fe3+/spermidine/putrescine transport system ATPase subunit